MNIFITGGSGFIGKNIIEFLSKKHTVFAPPHKELELLDADAVKKYFERYYFDVVIHSAVRPGHRNAKDPTNQLYNNLRMFFNLMRNKSRFKKLIFISSGAVYDITRSLSMVNEDFFDAYVPADEHGFSKYIIAKHIEQLDNIVELRVFGIFGKYEDYAIRFISNAICKTIFDLPVTIKQNRRFSYLYINDFVPILDYFINNDCRYKAYNVTPDEGIELCDIAKKVRSISGKDLPINIAKSGMGLDYSGSNKRLHNEIKGLKFTGIDSAIKELHAWYLQNAASINRDFLLFDK